jgi:ABC-2 type transport system permease protein
VAGEATGVTAEAVDQARASADAPDASGPAGRSQTTLPARSLLHEARGAKIVWQREMIRFWQDRSRIVISLLQPVLFLFVLGTGLSSLVSNSTGGVSLRTFMFPGVLAMSTMFIALFSAGSLVWDREFGFLREMLVAPVSRASILIGKAVGGASVATIPGVLMLALAGVVGVPYSPMLMLTLVVELLLLSFVLTVVGLVLAGRMKQIQTFMAMTQLFVLPMLFLSGAMFPLTNLPAWLHVLTRINPLTYAVDPMRRAVFDHLDVSTLARARLSPGVTWGSWTVPIGVELLVVLGIGVALLAVAVASFNRTE